MIELIQFPWSPFCLVQRRILEFSGVRFKTTNLKLTGDRSLGLETHQGAILWRARSFATARNVVFETGEESQVIAKYLDQKLELGPVSRRFGRRAIHPLALHRKRNRRAGVQAQRRLLSGELFHTPDQLSYIRHKERKFGRGCLDQWREDQKTLARQQLAERLLPFEQMLTPSAVPAR